MSQNPDAPRTIVSTVYVMFLIGILVQAAMIAGVLIAHAKKADVADDPTLDGHLTWLIQTFWIAAPIIALAAYLVFEQGMLMAAWLFLVWPWVIYRVVKGAVRYWKGAPVPAGLTSSDQG